MEKKCENCKHLEQCEIKIIIHNFSYGGNFKIKKGDKIAQILLKEHKTYLFGIESDKERLGGFGSTDK